MEYLKNWKKSGRLIFQPIMGGKVHLFWILALAIPLAGFTSPNGEPDSERDESESGDSFSFFAEQVTLKAVLKTDLRQLIRNPNENTLQDALFSLELDNGTTIDYAIKVRPRGISRRNICNMPPLLLKFQKDKNQEKKFRFKGDIKLVSYCQNKMGFEDFVLKEYLAYKIYNTLTDYSLRVRLVEITYVDENDKIKPVTKYSFMIEDIDEMAKRVGCREQKVESVPLFRLNQNCTTDMDLFQYMIGNTDWSCLKLHNVKIISPRDTAVHGGMIPVPYDFDYSGLVNATYAVPNADLGISSVTERVFRGMCRAPEEYSEIFGRFIGKKSEILGLIEDMEEMSKTTRNYCRRYIEQFYQIIESPRSADYEIIKQCRK